MTRKHLYQFVAEHAAADSEQERLSFLRGCVAAMRTIRAMPASATGAVRELLDDPAFAAVLSQDDALGQIYQALNAPRLEAAYRRTARQRDKFTSHEIPAVTQLFTPRWVVQLLLEHTLGRIEPDPARPVREIRILDPACDTMNFGVVAIEMLREMYLREMDRAGRTGWPA